MRAMILAAGRGERMRHLSQARPKPLQLLAGQPLISYQIERLARAGVRDIMINVSYLAEQIIETLGNGSQYGVNLHYSVEPELLGTAGGVKNVLDFFEGVPFILTSSDIWHDFDFSFLTRFNLAEDNAHLVFVPNPDHHQAGDFCLNENGQVTLEGANKLTYAGMGVFKPQLFADIPEGPYSIGSILEQQIIAKHVSGQKHSGVWRNIDTPERLAEIELIVT